MLLESLLLVYQSFFPDPVLCEHDGVRINAVDFRGHRYGRRYHHP